jgi:hypothetical protein
VAHGRAIARIEPHLLIDYGPCKTLKTAENRPDFLSVKRTDTKTGNSISLSIAIVYLG